MARIEVGFISSFSVKLCDVSSPHRQIQIKTTVPLTRQLHSHSNSWIRGERNVLENEPSAIHNGIDTLLRLRCIYPQRKTITTCQG